MIDTPRKKLGYLSSMEVFRDLSEDEVEAMGRQTTMASCAAGKIFYMPDDVGEVLFLLKKGRVQLYRISPGATEIRIDECGGFFSGGVFLPSGTHIIDALPAMRYYVKCCSSPVRGRYSVRWPW